MLSNAQGADVMLSDVCKSYGGNHVLRAVNMKLDAGRAYCLMAPSGSGKTTLFRILLGLESVDSGKIEGVPAGLVSAMFQEDRLCERLTPVENVLLVDPAGAMPRQQARALLAEILPESCLDQPASQLSGGMRRRVSLARAIAYPGRMLLLDEPFTGLDTRTRQRVIEFVLVHARGRTLLVATHGENDAEALGATVIKLDEVQKQ